MFELVKRQRPTNMLRLLDHFRHDLDDFDKLFEGLSHFHGFPTLAGLQNPDFSPNLNVVEKKDCFLVSTELPGMAEEDVEIALDDDRILTIKGEKKQEKKDEGDDYVVCECSYGGFRREIPLPKNVDVDGITASFEKGVLALTLPKVKVEEKKTARKIEIKK